MRFTCDELTEIGRLFRAKLHQLREQERRPRRSAAKRHRTVSRRHALIGTVESPPDERDLLSSGEVALVLNVSPKAVARWAADGGLPSIRTIGGHRRYRWPDVTAWLERGDAQGPSGGWEVFPTTKDFLTTEDFPTPEVFPTTAEG